MRQTVALLRKRVVLEPSQSEKIRIKKDIDEIEHLIVERLEETQDFKNFKLEEDVY